jgi:hypothetical protein
MDINFPCICGHVRYKHNMLEGNYIVMGCEAILYGFSNDGSPTEPKWCECSGFKFDNLKYLEMLSASK